MSTDVLRGDALTIRKHELTSAASSQSGTLRSLYHVTALIRNNASLSALVRCQFDAENQPPPTADEESWLKPNSLLSGRCFDEASLPTPTTTQDAALTYASKPTSTITQPIGQAQAAFGTNAPPAQFPSTTTPDQSTIPDAMATATVQKPLAILTDVASTPALPPPTLKPNATRPDGLSAPPSELAPPEAEEAANFTAATKDLLNPETHHRPAKTVHLPSEEVQEERLREVEGDRRRKSGVEDDKPSRLAAEAASSPSSTVGAYSAATPMPQQESPDTSPDSETAVEVPPELQPTLEERRAKEQHDRHLAAQKGIAHQQALGDVSTPDDQLRWEEREAAARDAEEKAAREGVAGPEPNSEDAMEITESEEVQADLQTTGARPLSASDDATTLNRPASTDSALKPPALEDTIVAIPRKQAPKAAPNSVSTVDSVEHRANRRAQTSEAIQLPGPSESVEPDNATGSQSKSSQPLSIKLESIRRRSSIEPVSPKSMLNSSDPAAADRAAILQTPKQSIRPQASFTTPTKAYPSLVDLSALRGAAEDPYRDYLEPLFKIQAHDATNIRTATLPDLVRSATKNLSTDDQFTSMHERMDYRILRRIYQLQNANKWSFRQMEKCKEPEQPVTHHDRMMKEMKWMCKDFRHERKSKKIILARAAQECATWVAAGPEERARMQRKWSFPSNKKSVETDDELPELEAYSESANEDNGMPTTPRDFEQLPIRVIVAPELARTVHELQRTGSLNSVLKQLPVWKRFGYTEAQARPQEEPMTNVSKFVKGKVLPKLHHPLRKRSRFDYEDEADTLEEPANKRVRDERELPAEDQDIALFHPDNKPIRDRLHANNAFRPPSEFQMPGTPFYEFRNGSQWIWEDDQKLRKLAKDYSFNWSLISDEMTLPSRFKSGTDRRTPWECFERWVELEQLPAEMRKTMYFKTWFGRLEQSQQANERRYQAQVAAVQQQQAQNPSGSTPHMPVRRRTQPTRVEKRKNNRYLWLVDAMRKLAKKRELAAYKQAEAQRAAQQRKSSQQTDANQSRGPMLTPQQWSQRRYERDLQVAEIQRAHRQRMMNEAQQKQAQSAQMARQQQGMPNGVPHQQRPAGSIPAQPGQMQVNGQQQHPTLNGQMPAQNRQSLPMATRNGHLAVPQINAPGVPQAQMRPQQPMGQHHNIQQMAQGNGQTRSAQYAGQQYQMPNGNMVSPGNGGMSNQQQLASNQALLAAFQAQQHQPQQANNASSNQSTQAANNQQMSASPSMPPPPTPAVPQQLSSGHVPAVIAIKNQLRTRYPAMAEEQLMAHATESLKNHSQSSNQARQNAMNAAAGITTTASPAQSNMQAYNNNQNQTAFQQNNHSIGVNGTNSYPSANGDASNNQQPSSQSQQYPRTGINGSASSPQHTYARMMQQRHMQQIHQSPTTTHANMTGSPSLAHASPNMAPASPSLQYNNSNGTANLSAMQPPQQQTGMSSTGTQQQTGQQRPPSRNSTPHIQRLGSSSGVPSANGMQSPGAAAAAQVQAVQAQAQAAAAGGAVQQNSPRNMQASMAR